MSYVARDGKILPTAQRGRLYEQSLESMPEKGKRDVENAPGGEEHIANVKAHGVVAKSTIEHVGNGRWRHTAVHADGTESTSVHPQWFRAHEVQGKYFDPDGKPPALETHQKGRSHPAGEKEERRIAQEDHREVEDEE